MKHLDTRWRNFPATLCWGVQLKFLAPFQHWLKLANSDGHFSLRRVYARILSELH